MPTRRSIFIGLAALVVGCATAKAPPDSPRPDAHALALHAIALPGAADGGIFMDYIAYEPGHQRLWVPAGNTGEVDVINPRSGQLERVGGFPTAELERNGHKRTVGPSSAAVGEGVVYVGNRGDQSVCAIDAASLQKGACLKLDSMPDGLAYVASAKELWVTTPRSKSIQILDASAPASLRPKAVVKLEGEPEGFAIDDAQGTFFTNLEDQDRTLAIDIKSRSVKANWASGCGEDGPKGLALDRSLGFLFLACTDKVKVLDLRHEGKELSSIDTGAGVDNIEYLESRRTLYAGAARAGQLTVAVVDDQGKLSRLALVPTSSGARNAVVAADGTAFLTDSPQGRILVVSPPASR